MLTLRTPTAPGLAVVFRKELGDGLRERRVMISALVFGPLLGPILFAVLTSYAVNLRDDEALRPIDVPVVGGSVAFERALATPIK